MTETILVTGAAGFVGMHACVAFLERGYRVVGVDNLTPYYDVQLKHDRIAQIRSIGGDAFSFSNIDIADHSALRSVKPGSFKAIVHLAAQAGVRYSIEQPFAYAHSNLLGMTSVLELARHASPAHFVYASSSSVYGGNTKVPFSESDRVDRPVSFYAATKRANEAMAYSYCHLFRVPTTGLRFFTVYGPWGRPDMAPWLFTDAILRGKPIKVFGQGELKRDFTYIDDIVEALVKVTESVPALNSDGEPHALFNIGNNQPNTVNELIDAIERATGRGAIRQPHPMPPGDVPITYADTDALRRAVGFRPNTSLHDGIGRFVDWFKNYYRIER